MGLYTIIDMSLNNNDNNNQAEQDEYTNARNQFCPTCAIRLSYFADVVGGFACSQCNYVPSPKATAVASGGGRSTITTPAGTSARNMPPSSPGGVSAATPVRRPMVRSTIKELEEEAYTTPLMARRSAESALYYKQRENKSRFENIGRGTSTVEHDMLRLESKGVTVQKEIETVPSDSKSYISTSDYNQRYSRNKHFLV